MTNALTYKHNLARVTANYGKACDLEFDLDHSLWPWLCLPAWHPVLVEKFQYFSAMTASWDMGTFEPSTFTALTQFSWRCTQAALDGHYPSRGRCDDDSDGESLGFQLSVNDADNRPLYLCNGQGFAFADRDFQQWRSKSRQACLRAPRDALKPAVQPHLAGLPDNGHSFVSACYEKNGMPTVQAVVASEDGFYPKHPFHTGSGDHVNAAQLIDCALQAAHVFTSQQEKATSPLICDAGEARFQRYVELDVPFEISLVGTISNSATLRFAQAGRENVSLRLQLRPADC